MKKILPILFLFLFTATLQSQSSFKWNTKKTKIKIPFELTHNLIIIDVYFNSVPLKMIADTGADKSLLFSFSDKDSLVLPKTEKIEIKGVGSGEKIDAYLTKHNQLKIKEYQDDNFELLLIPDQDISIINKLGIPINGILGSSFFKSAIVEINYQKKQLILHKKQIEPNDSRLKNYQKLPVTFDENKPYALLPITLNNSVTNYKLLFDTGLGDGLWLFENDTLKCQDIYFEDVLGVGLSGNITGKKSRINKINFAGLRLENALVSYPDSISFNQITLLKDRNGSLGGEILKRFNWFIDYNENTFYFKKNSFFELPFEYNMSGIEIQHSGSEWVREAVRKEEGINKINVDEFVFEDSSRRYNYDYKLKPIFQIYSVRKNSSGERAGLRVGDKILKINSKFASQLTIQNITDLFQSENGKRIYMTVERDGKQLQFEFLLEKIL